MELFSRPDMEATRLRLARRFNDSVDQWWLALPGRLSKLSQRWSLIIREPVGCGNTSLVLRCSLADHTPAMLKLVPEYHLAVAESQALLAWQATGRVPAVFGADPEEGALLMEAIPGELSLKESGASSSLVDVGTLIRELHEIVPCPSTHAFESLGTRVNFMFARCAHRLTAQGIVPHARLQSSHRLAIELAMAPSRTVLLHGDLHAANILVGGPGRGLVAIDPRPCLGDAAFDAIDHVFWPPASPSVWARRCDDLAGIIGCTRARLWDWCRSVALVIAVAKLANGASSADVADLLEIAP